MPQNSFFEIKIPPDETIKFEQEATFENFIGQFQMNCPKLLCVVDGTSLRFYSKRHELPTNIRFDYKQRRGKLTEYYFRDIRTDTLYCVFGRDCAKIFYPRIDEVDPTGIPESVLVREDRKDSVQREPERKDSVQRDRSPPKEEPKIQRLERSRDQGVSEIIDRGVAMTFPYPNYPILARVYEPL